jgi:hypothetical protein
MPFHFPTHMQLFLNNKFQNGSVLNTAASSKANMTQDINVDFFCTVGDPHADKALDAIWDAQSTSIDINTCFYVFMKS